MGGGDGKRRKGVKVGQFIHVCAAQTVDNGTEVDGRPTALLMEQLKCGLTTHWLFHVSVSANNSHALETINVFNTYGSSTFFLGCAKKLYLLW